jgi:hypothetical protein
MIRMKRGQEGEAKKSGRRMRKEEADAEGI